ncbi:hypothetical protein TNCV_4659381 [Trichonephila clavipes]|nr:hypothetical protein TNCV_4659381 [Trichonephila clavipes]
MVTCLPRKWAQNQQSARVELLADMIRRCRACITNRGPYYSKAGWRIHGVNVKVQALHWNGHTNGLPIDFFERKPHHKYHKHVAFHCDEDDTLADNSPSKLPHPTNVRNFDLDVFNVHQLLFNTKLLWYQGSNTGHEFITMTIRLPWPQKKIASLKEM